CEIQGCPDIRCLRALVAATNKNDQRRAAADEIDAISGSIVDPQLGNTDADGFGVAGVAERQTSYTDENASPSFTILQPREPAHIGIGLADLDHASLYPVGYSRSSVRDQPYWLRILTAGMPAGV